MKTVELEPSLVEDIKALLADEEMSERLHKYIRRMKAKLTKQPEAAPAEEHKMKPYIVEEPETEIADFAVGQVVQEERERYGRLPAQAEKLTPFTMEELEAEIAESEADFAAGREYSSEQVFREIREKYGWKCR